MSDEANTYLCELIGERISDLEMTMEDNPEGSEEHTFARDELKLALTALEEL